MRSLLTLKTLTVLLLYNSIILLPPALLALVYQDGQVLHFGTALVISFMLGLLCYRFSSKKEIQVHSRDGFLIVSMLWITIGLLGSLPFVISAHMGVVDAVFESISAFTTTGATTIAHGIDKLPKSLLFYRQELQWFGGIGVIVSAISLFPVLGIGASQLYRSEITGPDKKERIIPRIAQTARKTFNIYVALTLACALLFWLNGMSVFDAVAHSLTTISTGGFSTHDESLAYFHSFGIELVAMAFMLLGALNFSLHYAALNGLSLRPYWHNSETRLFLKIIAVSTAIITLYLFYSEPVHDLLSAARRVSFTVISMITTTGYSIDDFSLWPAGMAMLILYVGIIGGCAGSTSGGIKVVRFLVLLKLGTREIMQLTHPHSQLSFKLDRRVIRPEILQAIMSYTSLYVATFLILILLLLASGMDMVTAYGAATTCLNNLGPGLGSVANNFASTSDFQKIILSMAMLLGRLELLTIMIIFSPAYWRR